MQRLKKRLDTPRIVMLGCDQWELHEHKRCDQTFEKQRKKETQHRGRDIEEIREGDHVQKHHWKITVKGQMLF